MTNSNTTTIGQILMDVAAHLRGRSPIASAMFKNGLGNCIHILEFQDGECVLINRSVRHPSQNKVGSVKRKLLAFPESWESRQDSLKSISEKFKQLGFFEVFTKRTGNLPLLQMNFEKPTFEQAA